MTFDPTDPLKEIEYLKAVEKAKLYEAPPDARKLKQWPAAPDVRKLKKPQLWRPVQDDDAPRYGMPGIPADEAARFGFVVGVLCVLALLVDKL